MSAKWNTTVRGHIELSASDLAARIQRDGPRSLDTVSGDYVVVAESSDTTHLISSASGIVQHYYAVNQGRLYHGTTVADVVKQARLPRKDNWSALGDVASLGYVLGNASLHRDVHRVPRASVITFSHGSLSVDTCPWEELFPHQRATPDTTLKAFDTAIERLYTPGAAVSMSAGLDSRAILSACLAGGHKPRLLVMGMPDSTDVVVARRVARQEGLDLEVVELDFLTYLTEGQEVVCLTNGTKFPENWHTFFYARASSLQGSPLFVGTNGEFARTYMVGSGPIGQVAAIVGKSPRLAHEVFWRKYIRPTFVDIAPDDLHPAFAEAISEQALDARRNRAIDACRVDGRLHFLQGLDRYYLEQRVQNFMGNGVRLLEESVQPRLPFLDRDWMVNAWNLDRRYKQGSNWHRMAIQSNWPSMLDLPEPGVSSRTATHVGWRQWLPRRWNPKTVPYAPYAEWFRSAEERAFLLDNLAHMEWIVEPHAARRLIEEHSARGSRRREINFLHTMALWDKVMLSVTR